MHSNKTALRAERAGAPLAASAGALAQPTHSDAQLRRRLFWAVLGSCAALAALSYWLQQRYSYDLNPAAPRAREYQSAPPRYGSYGLYLARASPAPAPTTTVAILSNSVYFACGIADQMQTWANAEGRDMRFLNFAQTGSGIHDHIVQMPQALRAGPQLVVVAFINLAFSPRNGDKTLPKFRTDIDQTAFDPAALGLLPASFYWREFTLNEGGSAALATIWPAKRLDWLLRRNLNDFVTAQLGRPPAWFEQQFPSPTLNLAGDWLRAQEAAATRAAPQPAYAESGTLLDELVALARARGVGLLLLRQESGPLFDKPEIWPLVQQACGKYERAFAVDLKAAFDPEQLKDQVHPSPGVARVEYAQRHYRVILDVLQRMAAQPGARGARAVRDESAGGS